VAEGEDTAPDAVQVEKKESEEVSEVPREQVSREVQESGVVQRRAAAEREEPELMRDTGISAFAGVEENRGEDREEPSGTSEVYTRLGTTSYEGNLRPEQTPRVAFRETSGEDVAERRSVAERPERASEEVSRHPSVEAPEVGDQERPSVTPQVRRATEEVPERDVGAQEASNEISAAGFDETPVSGERAGREVPESNLRLGGERPSGAGTEAAPSADVVRRAPRAARPEAPPDHLVREGEEAPSERIERSRERASVSPESVVSRARDAEDLGERASVDTEGPGLQDVPLQEALFGASEVVRRARSSQEEAGETETSFVLPSISFRSPETRERSSSEPVQRAEEAQAPAEPTAEVGSTESEAPDLGEEEETGEGIDVGKLADEVYRRIRDRLRIERERYGRRGRW
jgi:hypothetical protein